MISPPPVIEPPQTIPELPPALETGARDLLRFPLTQAPPLTVTEQAELWMEDHKTTVYLTAGTLLLLAVMRRK